MASCHTGNKGKTHHGQQGFRGQAYPSLTPQQPPLPAGATVPASWNPRSSSCSQFLPLVVSLLSSASRSSLSQRLQLSGQMSPALQAFPDAVPCPPTSVPFLCVPGLRATYHHLKSQLSCFAVECLSAPGECELHGARQTCLSWSSRGHQLLEQRLRRLRY